MRRVSQLPAISHKSLAEPLLAGVGTSLAQVIGEDRGEKIEGL
jgi:hypothetical protein